MSSLGYTMMCEQRSPKDLVADVVQAEAAGFDFAVISDHFHPWLEAQGHSPYIWSVLGAAAQATERIGLMTYVTTPTIRYHPAIIAQKAATVALLADGRFRLGLGAGERLNEHVVGRGFPMVDIRHEMLYEAVDIIRQLWTGDYVTHHGKHFDVEKCQNLRSPGGGAADWICGERSGVLLDSRGEGGHDDRDRSGSETGRHVCREWRQGQAGRGVVTRLLGRG